MASFISPSLPTPGFAKPGFAKPGFDKPGFAKPNFAKPGFASPMPSPAATAALASVKAGTADGATIGAGGKALQVAQDFEAVFLNSMFQQMFSNVGQGPFSGGHGAGIWRSFLTDEYSKTFVKAGGIGIADQVMRALLARQEVK